MTHPPETDLKHSSKYMAIPPLNGFETQFKTGEFEVFHFKLCTCVTGARKRQHVSDLHRRTKIRTNGNNSQTECEKLIFNWSGPISTQN